MHWAPSVADNSFQPTRTVNAEPDEEPDDDDVATEKVAGSSADPDAILHRAAERALQRQMEADRRAPGEKQQMGGRAGAIRQSAGRKKPADDEAADEEMDFVVGSDGQFKLVSKPEREQQAKEWRNRLRWHLQSEKNQEQLLTSAALNRPLNDTGTPTVDTQPAPTFSPTAGRSEHKKLREGCTFGPATVLGAASADHAFPSAIVNATRDSDGGNHLAELRNERPASGIRLACFKFQKSQGFRCEISTDPVLEASAGFLTTIR